MFGGTDKLNQDGRLPPPENDPPRKVTPPKPGTVWATVLAGVTDMRCSHREAHIFNVLHALGINPDLPWPPDPEVEFALRGEAECASS